MRNKKTGHIQTKMTKKIRRGRFFFQIHLYQLALETELVDFAALCEATAHHITVTEQQMQDDLMAVEIIPVLESFTDH